MLENLRVWAPKAHHLTLHLTGEDRRLEMVPLRDSGERVERGWWVSPIPLEPGARYLLSVDDQPPFPDPRTRRQPEGIHGPSEIVDFSSFGWTDAGWRGVEVRGALTYELHVGTFTPEGTFASAIGKLPHLKELGVDLVEVMPIVPVPGTRNWGYDGVELYAVTENYGGPESFAAFVDAAHAEGMGVCLDVVYNHLGPDGNYLSVFGPYFTDAHETPWGWAVNLDGEDNGPVRRFIIDNAMQWVRDYHVDALRLDAVAHLIDNSPRHILAELSDEIYSFAAASGRRIGLIAESDLNDPLMVTPTCEGGLGMDCQWDDDIHHALHAHATGETFAYYADFAKPGALEKVFRNAFVHDGTYSAFREKHWGAPVGQTIDGHAFVAFTEDHDQVGNRAIGDRPSAKLSPGQRAAQLSLLLASPFSPMLFMGQEWGTRRPFQFFTDHDGDLGEAVAEGRQNEFADWDWLSIYDDEVRGAGTSSRDQGQGHRLTPPAPDDEARDSGIQVPNPQAEETFRTSVLDWAELDEAEHAKFLAFTKAAVALRKEVADFASGDITRTELVRLDRSGYLRRGESYVVYSLEADARVSVAMRDPVATVSWGEPKVSTPREGVTQIDFAEPGVVFLLPA